MYSNKINRRTFVKAAGTSLVVIPFSSLAQDTPPRLAEDDPMAIALGYKELSSEVDAAKYPTHKPEQVCTGCALYTGDDPEWGGCGAFPGKQVAGPGWCVAFAAKPS